MRLTAREQNVITETIFRFDPLAEIWLFGSRANDDLKGGDIDLLVISSKIDFSEKMDILIDIKLAIGDQKIDLTTLSPDRAANDPLAREAKSAGVRLGRGS